MSKTSIIIIIFCTVLMAVIAFFSLKEESGMEDVFLASSSNIEEDFPEKEKAEIFPELGSSIYVIIPLRGAKKGEAVDVKWIYDDGGTPEVLQKDHVTIEKDGSGNIAVYLLKRDSSYLPGLYQVEVEYMGSQKRQARFTVTGSS